MTTGTSGLPRGSTNTKYDRVLDEYFPQRQGDLLYQLVENKTDTLLLAVLYELQEMNDGRSADLPSENRPDQHEADYWSTEQPLPVTSTSESDHRVNWGFPATSVTIWGFDEPIFVSFRSNGDHRRIPLDPQDAPFSLAPEGGLGSSLARFRLPNDEANSTEVKILAMD